MPQSKYFGNFNSITIKNMCGEIMFKHALVMAYQLNGSIYFSVEKFGITLKKVINTFVQSIHMYPNYYSELLHVVLL